MKIECFYRNRKIDHKSGFLQAMIYCYTILETSDHVEKDGICCFLRTFFLLLRLRQEHCDLSPEKIIDFLFRPKFTTLISFTKIRLRDLGQFQKSFYAVNDFLKYI